MKKELVDKLNKCRGNIIADATSVEIALDWKLRSYFFPKTNQKAASFHSLILNSPSFGFGSKVNMYKEISYFKKLKNYTKTKQCLNSIKNTRNAMAHWSTTFHKECSEEQFVVYNPKMSKTIVLNKKTIADFKEKVDFVLTDFGFSHAKRDWEF